MRRLTRLVQRGTQRVGQWRRQRGVPRIRPSVRLAAGSLAASRASSGISVALVATSVLFVVGADRAFVRVAEVVTRLADGGTAHRASIDVSRCPRCSAVLSRSLLLQHLVQVTAVASVRVHRVGRQPLGGRTVPVRCVSPAAAPTAVAWHSAAARLGWADAAGEPLVAIGAQLAPTRAHDDASRILHTNLGPWSLAGVLRARPLLAGNAAENTTIVAPWREPFLTLCDRGRAEWQVLAPDSGTLQQRLSLVNGELRTTLQLRPGQQAPWRISPHDRFAALLATLVRRFAVWVFAVPVVVALLCGAGIFCVQTLETTARTHEFGVRRAVGATRSAIVGQLIAEAVLVCAAGVAAACVLLAGAGLVAVRWTDGMQAVWLALCVAVPLTGAGLVIPGVSALRAASIAALEGRGDQ